MRRALICGLCAAVLFGAPRPAAAISSGEIVLLTEQGVSAEVIIKYLKLDKTQMKITAAVEARLRGAGVAERIIIFVKSGRDPGPGKALSTADRRRAAAALRAAESAAAYEARKASEANRLRAEAARLRREAATRKALSKEMDGQARSVLAKGFDELRTGSEWQAVATFHRFLASKLVPVGHYGYLEAKYGLASALLNMKMYQAAAGHLVTVISAGPRTPRFDKAVLMMQKVVDETVFVHPVIAMLDAFERELEKSRKRAWLDEYHYFLGDFFEGFNNSAKAMAHFKKVSAKSKRYPAARYHLGLILTKTKQYLSGFKRFRESRKSALAKNIQPVWNLATLALARLAFEVGRYDNASHFYTRVNRRSHAFARAQYELSWTQVMSSKYSYALGTIHGLHSPLFKNEFFPDILVLEAAVYLNMCRYKEAAMALKRFEKMFEKLLRPIRAILEKNPSEDELYKAVQMAASGGAKAPLPRLALNAMLADVSFFRALKTAKQIETEQRTVRIHLKGPARLAVLKDLKKRRGIYLQRVGLEIRRRLRDIMVEFDGVKVKADEITIEVDIAEKSRLEKERRAIDRGKGKRKRKGKRTGLLRLKPGQQSWPFEGEYWLDEIGAFRSRLRQACPVRAKIQPPKPR